MFTGADANVMTIIVAGKGDGYQEFRGVASKHWDTMKTYYQKVRYSYSTVVLSIPVVLPKESF